VAQRRDDSDSDDNSEPLIKHLSPAYDASVQLSSSLGHLQLECVPEHLTEQDEELQHAASDVNDDSDMLLTAVHKSAAATSDDGLEQHDADECMSASVCNTAGMTVPIESKSLVYFIALLAIS